MVEHELQPPRLRLLATGALMALTVWVFCWQMSLGAAGFERAIYAFGLIPAVLVGHASLPPDLALLSPPWTFLTALFVHGKMLPLAGNLFYLWLFGGPLEDAVGSLRFLGFYCVCGVFAALTQTVIAPQSLTPMIGAGGALSGVLGGYLLLYPRASRLSALPFVARPGRLAPSLLLALWCAVQIATAVRATPATPGIAWYAHIGGFITGAVLMLFLRRDNTPVAH